MTLDFNVTEVFTMNHKSDSKIILDQGGTRSSKSYSIAQLMILKVITERNKRVIVCRKTFAALRKTLLRDFIKVLGQHNILDKFIYNKSNATLLCKQTKSTIEFVGLEDSLKIQGLSCNYFVIEEAIEVEYPIFQQLILRMTDPSSDGKKNQCYLLYNPSNVHSWIKTKIIDKRTDYDLIISTYEDNSFLTLDAIKEIELLKQTDHDAWLCYGQGDWSSVKGAIFKNYDTYDTLDESEIDEVYYGLDFGFVNDITAVSKVYVKKKTKELFIEQIFGERGLTNQDISEQLFSQINNRNVHIVADSAEMKSIEELRRLGWKHIQGVKKGPNSINFGIQLMKQYKIHLNSTSNDLITEFQNYKWIEGKDGEALNLPCDDFNHYIDSIRYVVMTYLSKGSGKIFIR